MEIKNPTPKKLLIILVVMFLLIISCENEKHKDPYSTKSTLIISPKTEPDGKHIYMKTCMACHQKEGEGIAGIFPPLANSDYLNQDTNRAIEIVLQGISGEITVNGVNYNSIMMKQDLTDTEIANVLTYIYNNWGNSKNMITPEIVNTVRMDLVD